MHSILLPLNFWYPLFFVFLLLRIHKMDRLSNSVLLHYPGTKFFRMICILFASFIYPKEHFYIDCPLLFTRDLPVPLFLYRFFCWDRILGIFIDYRPCTISTISNNLFSAAISRLLVWIHFRELTLWSNFSIN